MDKLPRNLEDLTALLLDREIALHLAEARHADLADALNADPDGFDGDYWASQDRVQAARRRVEAVRELIGYLTPSSYLTNYR